VNTASDYVKQMCTCQSASESNVCLKTHTRKKHIGKSTCWAHINVQPHMEMYSSCIAWKNQNLLINAC